MTAFRRLAIPDVIEVTPARVIDARGSFCETYRRSAFEAEGIDITWTQDNQSRSVRTGTVRGLHFQAPPFAQAKLIRVLAGAIFDVAVDLRRGSATYGRWVGATLSADNGVQTLIPAGFAHGFMTLGPDTEVLYKVDAPYAPAHQGAIRWDDPALAIAWPDPGVEPVLSERDRDAPGFAGFVSPFAVEA